MSTTKIFARRAVPNGTFAHAIENLTPTMKCYNSAMEMPRFVNRIIDAGGDYFHRMDDGAMIAKMRGDAAEKRRQQIMALRERRDAERHRWDKEGRYIGRGR